MYFYNCKWGLSNTGGTLHNHDKSKIDRRTKKSENTSFFEFNPIYTRNFYFLLSILYPPSNFLLLTTLYIHYIHITSKRRYIKFIE